MAKKEFLSKFLRHETKKKVLFKFVIIFSIAIVYLLFAMFRYGTKEGSVAAIFTWSMFVLCTPIADAGFLMDFPVRLLTRIRMLYSELVVWCIAISLNIVGLLFFPAVYDKTLLLRILKFILLHPFPYWSIIILSMMGTFFSVYFGDELIDISRHKDRKKHQKHNKKRVLIITLFIVLVVIFLYYQLANRLGISF